MFDPETLFGNMGDSVVAISTAITTVMTAAGAIYLSFLAWRKFRESASKI